MYNKIAVTSYTITFCFDRNTRITTTMIMTMIMMMMNATPPVIMLVEDQPLVDPIGPVVFIFPVDSGSEVVETEVGKVSPVAKVVEVLPTTK